jgi:predicted N-acetyltransferase YhbS
MFVMRLATSADERPIAMMIRARSSWMRDRGIRGWEGWESSADVLAGQAADPAFPVWVLTGQDGAVVGCTSLYEESPPWFWTEAEQAEQAFFLATTVTDPAFAGQRLGCLIVWSVLDLATRTGKAWVRRGTTEPGLIRYYRDVQGWSVVREKEHKGVHFIGMARRAELQPELPVRVLTPTS